MVLKFISLSDNQKINKFAFSNSLSIGNNFFIHYRNDWLIDIELFKNNKGQITTIMRIYTEDISGDDYNTYVSNIKMTNLFINTRSESLTEFLDIILGNELYEINELKVFLNGYDKIKHIKNEFPNPEKDEIILKILDLPDNQDIIDTNIFAKFLNNPNYPEQVYGDFLINEVLKYPGYLIDEYIFAARLGISLNQLNENQKKEWEKIKEYFKKAKYTGVFSDKYQRWWMEKINNIFEELSGNIYLIELEADQRVNILKDKLSLKYIEPAKPIKGNNSTEYWTICKVLKEPLDTVEGLKSATEKELYCWQEYEYYSLKGLSKIVNSLSDCKSLIYPVDWNYDLFINLLKDKGDCK